MIGGAKLPPGLVTAPLVSDWVWPEADGFALRTGRAELGQGVGAAMLRIASWELGLPVEALTISGPDTAFAPDEGVTAGSLSMTQGGAAMRAATSAAREICLAEAARRLNTARDMLSVINGRVTDQGAPTALTLATLARDVSFDVPVLDHARPLGQPEPAPDSQRQDLADRLVGAPFVHDLTMEGMRFGRVFLPPTRTARLPEDIDFDGLKARGGVDAVVRDGNFLGIVAQSVAAADAAAAWFEARLTWDDEVREPGPVEALLVQGDAQMELLAEPHAALPSGPPSVDTTVRRPFLSHAPIGPSAAVALWSDDRLTVWSHSQGVFPLRRALAAVLGLSEGVIRVIHMNGAGCYGHNGADDVALDAALLARAVPGQPVRLVWSRKTEFQTAPMGAASSTRVQLWMDGETLSGARISVTSAPHSTRPGTAGAPFLRSGTLLEVGAPFPRAPDLPAARGNGAARNALPIYAAPALVERKLVDDLPWRSSALRSLGAYLNVFAIETALDKALAAGGHWPAP